MQKPTYIANEYKICSKCVMDNVSNELETDEKGVCEFCKLFEQWEREHPITTQDGSKFSEIIKKIKGKGKGRKYDCILGISGGTDSMYLLYLLVKHGIKPLAVHFDNGWNSTVAVKNMKVTLEKLSIDLYTYVVDWNEFRNLQLAFLKASVAEVELPTDMGYFALLYRVASERNIRFILSGDSFRTEGILPKEWLFADSKYIQSVYNFYSKNPLKSFPNLTPIRYLYYIFIKRIKHVQLLNHIHYNKEEAKILLTKEFGWIDYSGHHYENIYSRFFMSYIAPVKFKMDRRKVNYSAKIRLGLMNRDEALNLLNKEIRSEDAIREDKMYICRKLEISPTEFDEILNLPIKSYNNFNTNFFIKQLISKLVHKIYTFPLFPKKLLRGKFTI